MTTRALFISNYRHLSKSKGGVQLCTHEFIRTIEACGIELEILATDFDRGPLSRGFRKLANSPYVRPIRREELDRIVMRSRDVDLIFLNQVFLAGAFSTKMLGRCKSVPIVALSHGCEITDLLHLVRLKSHLPLSGYLGLYAPLTLGRVLYDEYIARKALDAVVSISPSDAEFERWLGVKHITWLPRVIEQRALNWNPHQNRFGFVGTLDHAPSLEGLVEILTWIESAQDTGFRVRIVGSPEKIGAWLSARFRAVEYLGPLDDPELEAEAGSWTAFLHPIFCQARGCSTKLAKALEWSIPVITTPQGRRGYVWRSGGLTETTTPETFGIAMKQLRSLDVAQKARERVIELAKSSPALTAVAHQLNGFLLASGIVSPQNGHHAVAAAHSPVL